MSKDELELPSLGDDVTPSASVVSGSKDLPTLPPLSSGDGSGGGGNGEQVRPKAGHVVAADKTSGAGLGVTPKHAVRLSQSTESISASAHVPKAAEAPVAPATVKPSPARASAATPAKLLNGRRVHGFELPLHPSQLGAWFVFAFSIVVFGVFVVPFLPAGETHGDSTDWQMRYPVLGVYVLMFLIGFPAFWLVSTKDPVAPEIKLKEREVSRRDIYDHYVESHNGENTNTMCGRCDVPVHKLTKHCRLCKKCVPVFDHHCLYLNTCIGESNYRLFFTLISTCSALLLTQILATMIMLVQHNEDQFRRLTYDSFLYGKSDVWVVVVVTSCMSLVPLLGCGAIVGLLFFHIFISARNITTYSWIIERRRVAAEKEEAEEERRRREDESFRAKEEQKRKEQEEMYRRKREELERLRAERVAAKRARKSQVAEDEQAPPENGRKHSTPDMPSHAVELMSGIDSDPDSVAEPEDMSDCDEEGEEEEAASNEV